MKITFRLECPWCNWGVAWSDNFVNMGWIKLKCSHCDKDFFTKIAITGVKIETEKELPEDVPCDGKFALQE